jgi:hypothetical protein
LGHFDPKCGAQAADDLKISSIARRERGIDLRGNKQLRRQPG